MLTSSGDTVDTYLGKHYHETILVIAIVGQRLPVPREQQLGCAAQVILVAVLGVDRLAGGGQEVRRDAGVPANPYQLRYER